MNQQGQLFCPRTEQEWQEKVKKLQDELLQARIQQINLKRINRTLQETLKNTLAEQLQADGLPSTNRMSRDWKQKFELEALKNIQNQKYIKLLQDKTKTFSHKRQPKNRSSSIKLQVRTSNRPILTQENQFFTTAQQNFEPVSRHSSVKKMSNFMDRFMTSKYQVSDFGQEYNTNLQRPSYGQRRPLTEYRDPVEQVFSTLKSVKQNQIREDSQQDQVPYKPRTPYNQQAKTNFRTQSKADHLVSKKLSLTTHFR